MRGGGGGEGELSCLIWDKGGVKPREILQREADTAATGVFTVFVFRETTYLYLL